MVEPDRNGFPNLLQQVKKYLKTTTPASQEIYIQHIHRLDRPVSGIVLFAKQRSVLRNLSEQFAQRRVKKFYQALTANAPRQLTGSLTHWLRKEKKKAVIYENEVTWAEQVKLNYEVTSLSSRYYLWNIELITGKFHQIRAQLSYMGCPVLGDKFYDSQQEYKTDSIALHACKLIFHHPVTGIELSISKDSEFEAGF
jgi:23S rRNA-/tRNA-specific pseudouridylate synthase